MISLRASYFLIFQNLKYFHTVDFAFPVKVVHSLSNSAAIMTLLNMKGSITVNIIQLMTFHEVNTQIDQPMEHDIHRGIRGEYRVPWVDQSLYSPKLFYYMTLNQI